MYVYDMCLCMYNLNFDSSLWLFFIHTHLALLAAMIPTGVVIALIFLFILFVIFFVIGLYIKRQRKFAGMSSTCLCVGLGLVNFGLTFQIRLMFLQLTRKGLS